MSNNLKLLYSLIATLLVAVPALADVSFDNSPAGSGASLGGQTEMTLVTVAPGKLELRTTEVAGVWINQEPVHQKGVYTAPDDSGKGTAFVVNARDPALAQHALCWSGVGPNNWAGLVPGQKAMMDKLSCGAIDNAASVARITVPQKAWGSVFGLVPGIVNVGDGMTASYGSHPFGPTLFTVTRPDGTRDMITLIAVDNAGKFRAPTSTEVGRFQHQYLGMFGR